MIDANGRAATASVVVARGGGWVMVGRGGTPEREGHVQCPECRGRGNVFRDGGRGTCGVCRGTGKVLGTIPASSGCLTTILSTLLFAAIFLGALVVLYLWLQSRGEIPAPNPASDVLVDRGVVTLDVGTFVGPYECDADTWVLRAHVAEDADEVAMVIDYYDRGIGVQSPTDMPSPTFTAQMRGQRSGEDAVALDLVTPLPGDPPEAMTSLQAQLSTESGIYGLRGQGTSSACSTFDLEFTE